MNQSNSERLSRIIADLNAIESFTDVIYSLALDLDALSEFRLIVGFPAARRAAAYIIQGMRTAYGAIYRLNAGDLSAVWTLALAGQMIQQSVDLILKYLEVVQTKMTAEYKAKFDGQLVGFDKVEPTLRRIAKEIEVVVGPSLWNAAKQPIETILRPVQE